jgi:hypothetical protein
LDLGGRAEDWRIVSLRWIKHEKGEVDKPVYIDLQLLRYSGELQFREGEGRREIYDVSRRRWVVVTPEELVRQLLVKHLIQGLGYPSGRIAVEKGLVLHGRKFRFDMLAWGPDMTPLLLAECKAPAVALSEAVVWQVTRYNLSVRAPYSLVTNGQACCCARLDFDTGKAEWLEGIPPYPDM